MRLSNNRLLMAVVMHYCKEENEIFIHRDTAKSSKGSSPNQKRGSGTVEYQDALCLCPKIALGDECFILTVIKL